MLFRAEIRFSKLTHPNLVVMKNLPAFIAVLIVGVIVAVAISFTRGISVTTNVPNQPDDEQVFCTMDAMMCPDGSYVGRTGPNCQFVCPATATSTATSTAPLTPYEVTLKLDQTPTVGLLITPIAVLEDSRCPIDVQCIQAGTVRLNVRLDGVFHQAAYQELKLNEPATVGVQTVTLIGVTPAPRSTEPSASRDYSFTFSVK